MKCQLFVIQYLLAWIGRLVIEVLPGVRNIPIVGPILGEIVSELLEVLTGGLTICCYRTYFSINEFN